MKRLLCFVALVFFLQCAVGQAEVPPIVVKSMDELTQLPENIDLGVIEIEENAPVSALDAEKGIIPLLLLTPETAMERWGEPMEIFDTGSGKGYKWGNGYILEYTKANQLRRLLYWPAQKGDLPFSSEALGYWGFAPTKPDANATLGLRWKSSDGLIKDVLIQPVLLDGKKYFGSLQLVLNP